MPCERSNSMCRDLSGRAPLREHCITSSAPSLRLPMRAERIPVNDGECGEWLYREITTDVHREKSEWAPIGVPAGLRERVGARSSRCTPPWRLSCNGPRRECAAIPRGARCSSTSGGLGPRHLPHDPLIFISKRKSRANGATLASGSDRSILLRTAHSRGMLGATRTNHSGASGDPPALHPLSRRRWRTRDRTPRCMRQHLSLQPGGGGRYRGTNRTTAYAESRLLSAAQYLGTEPGDRPIARMHIRVMVDAQGRPDLTTLRVTGLGAAENRTAIEQWINGATFRPAMRNGQPVSGLFETRFEVRVSVRRM